MTKQTERSKNGKPSIPSQMGGSGWGNVAGKAKFISVSFNDTDKRKIQDLLPERDMVVCEFLCELALNFNISVKHDTLSGKWNALLLPYGDGHPFEGFILSVRHSDRLMALFGLAYAHVHKFDGKWPIGDNPDDDDWA